MTPYGQRMANAERLIIDSLNETTDIFYQVRLETDIFTESNWRECSSEIYFNVIRNRGFGGLVEARRIVGKEE